MSKVKNEPKIKSKLIVAIREQLEHRERHSGGHQRIRNRIIAENESEYHTEDQTDQARTSAGEETEDILLQRIKFACDRQ